MQRWLSISVPKSWDLVFKSGHVGNFPTIPEWLGSQRAEVGSKSYACLNFTDLLATRFVVDMRYEHVRDPEGRTSWSEDQFKGGLYPSTGQDGQIDRRVDVR